MIFLWSNDSGRSLVGPLLILALVLMSGFWVVQNRDWVTNAMNGQSSAHVGPPIVPPSAARGKTVPAPKAKSAAPRSTRAAPGAAPRAPVTSASSVPAVIEEPGPHSDVVYAAADLDIVPPTPLRMSQMVDALPPGVPSQRAVALELLIDEAGSVENVHRLSPPNPVRDAVAVSVAKGMRFRPGTKDGRAIRYRKVVWYVIPE